VTWLREHSFDSWQRLAPRDRGVPPVVVVEIDEEALEARGQWPWPRSLTAELVRKIAAAQPAALGLDILFVEPERAPGDGDATLAAAVREARAVVALAGLGAPDRRFPGPPASAPFRVASNRTLPLPQFGGHLQSRPEVQRAGAGWGLISADPSTRVIRRAPMLARVGETHVASLAAEMVRVATGVPLYRVADRGGDRIDLDIGGLGVPLQSDGSLWIRYGRHDASRTFSAEQVLSGRLPAEKLHGHLVLVGVTGVGLLDRKATPLGEQIPGVEIHAQVIEQLLSGTYLHRPTGATWLEALLLLLAGAGLVAAAPRIRPWPAALLALAACALLLAAGFAALQAGLLIDAAAPAAGTALVFAALLAATLAEADRQRRVLREAQARVAGELDAARRIQMGLLADPRRVFAGEPAFALRALLEPARTVGGDFYDCFRLDMNRVYFVVADVSGKGMPAALFMALSKAILKANVRREASELGVAFVRANAEIAAENPEALFITAFAGILDLRTGMLEYCNAGHEPPLCRRPGGALERFDSAQGPPLCALDEFEYPTSYRQLARGEWLCVVTDGVTEAMNASRELYGNARLDSVLGDVPAGAAPEAVVEAVREDVRRFVGAAEPSDDLTLLCLRWDGDAR